MDLYGNGHKFVTDDKVNTDVPMYRHVTNDDNWTNILGAKNAGNRVLVSFRDDTNGDGPTTGNFGSGIAFGGGDTKAILSVEFASPRARIAGGNGIAPSWYEDIAWKSDIQNLKQTMLKSVPHVNLLQNSAGPFFPQPNPDAGSLGQTGVGSADQWQIFPNSTVTLVKGETYTLSAVTNGVFSSVHDPNKASNKCVIWIGPPINMVISGENTSANTFTWDSDTGTYPIRVNRYGTDSQVKCWNIKIEHGSQATDWTPCPLDS